MNLPGFPLRILLPDSGFPDLFFPQIASMHLKSWLLKLKSTFHLTWKVLLKRVVWQMYFACYYGYILPKVLNF